MTRRTVRPSGRRRFVTALGPAAERTGSIWTLDLTGLPIFRGLSVVSRALGDLLIEQSAADVVDVVVERSVNPRENPELREVLGISRIKVSGEPSIMSRLIENTERLQDQLRVVFGTLQRQRYREALIPPDDRSTRALLFDFEGSNDGGLEYRAALEAVPSPKVAGQRHLRLTIDRRDGHRLHLRALPHLVVRDLDSRTFIAGSTRIAQTWREAIVREAERGRRSAVEANHPRSHVFRQFEKAGLCGLDEVILTWPDLLVPRLIESEPGALDLFVKHVLLALEDRGVRSVLDAGDTMRVVSGDLSAYLDRSHLGRILNVSLGGPRERIDLGTFLERMPATAAATEEIGAQPLRGVKVLLIHHMTAEVLGLIAALRGLGCRDLVTLFIAYGGEAPTALLGPLLDLPPDEFRCLALTNVPEPGRVEGRYRLSPRYSPIAETADWTAALASHPAHFEGAMRTVAAAEFFRLLARTAADGERCLLIEDGGYLGPLLNGAALEGRAIADLLGELGHRSEDRRSLREALDGAFIGSVEHTRNGYDRLSAVESRHGGLAFPALSIAVSDLKIHGEAREVATSILHAVESVLHAEGKVLARRTCLVLGSSGAIGRWLVRSLEHRLTDPAGQLLGVDLKADNGAVRRLGGVFEARRYGDLPPDLRRRIDLVVGVTGVSVLTRADVEEWLLTAAARELVLASGSTKTNEFVAVSEWLDRLLQDPAPQVQGLRVQIDSREVRDVHTGRVLGHRYRFALTLPGGQRRERDLVFLARLTPVNFLFYGVPNEAIDDVIAQLLRCAIGLTRHHTSLPARLLAVDRQISADGTPLGDEVAVVG